MSNHLSSILEAIDYIENHLKTNINMGDVAKHVGFSKYHFSRIFKDITGQSPYDYYRGRKVTEAIEYMKSQNCKIIEAAFEFGFNSPEVFTRSCLSSFGMSPSQLKRSIEGMHFNGYQRLTKFQLHSYEHYRHLFVPIESMPSVIVKGITYTTEDFFEPLDLTNPLHASFINKPGTYYHLHWTSDSSQNIYHHMLGTAVSAFDMVDEFDSHVYKKIPAGNYLAFPAVKAGNTFDSIRDYIYNYYLANHGYSSVKSFHLELLTINSEMHIHHSMLYVPGRTIASERNI